MTNSKQANIKKLSDKALLHCKK